MSWSQWYQTYIVITLLFCVLLLFLTEKTDKKVYIYIAGILFSIMFISVFIVAILSIWGQLDE
jgi:hypothetical protein